MMAIPWNKAFNEFGGCFYDLSTLELSLADLRAIKKEYPDNLYGLAHKGLH